jgi:acetyl esterase
MTLHPEAAEIAKRVSEAGLRPLSELTPGEARTQVATMREAMAVAGAQVSAPDELDVEGRGGAVHLRRYEPEDPEVGIIVFAHGGGWVLGTLDDCDPLCRRLVEATSCVLLSVDYRLAPEHPFPAAVDDVLDATTWASARWPEQPLLLVGESAGANLAAAAALRCVDDSATVLNGQVLIYPVTDNDFETPSYRAHGESPFLTREDMEWFWRHYAPTDDVRRHPWVSLVGAPLAADIAPAVVVLAGQDPLHDEGGAYADALRRAGVPVTVHDYGDMPHGFLSMLDALPAAEAPFAELALEIRRLASALPA